LELLDDAMPSSHFGLAAPFFSDIVYDEAIGGLSEQVLLKME
jgi:hypothetical protein